MEQILFSLRKRALCVCSRSSRVCISKYNIYHELMSMIYYVCSCSKIELRKMEKGKMNYFFPTYLMRYILHCRGPFVVAADCVGGAAGGHWGGGGQQGGTLVCAIYVIGSEKTCRIINCSNVCLKWCNFFNRFSLYFERPFSW